MGLFSGGASPPDAGQVSSQYQLELYDLMQALPGIYNKSAEYEPMFANLNNQITSGTRASGVADVAKLAPSILKTERAYDPAVTNLTDTLDSQAQQQLGLNGALDPATARSVQQQIRGAQTARGLGVGPGDAAEEQFYQTQTQEARRTQNQQLAAGAATQTRNTLGDPFSILLGYGQPVSTTSSIINPQSSQNLLGSAQTMVGGAQTANYNQMTGLDNGLIQYGLTAGGNVGSYAGGTSTLGGSGSSLSAGGVIGALGV